MTFGSIKSIGLTKEFLGCSGSDKSGFGSTYFAQNPVFSCWVWFGLPVGSIVDRSNLVASKKGKNDEAGDYYLQIMICFSSVVLFVIYEVSEYTWNLLYNVKGKAVLFKCFLSAFCCFWHGCQGVDYGLQIFGWLSTSNVNLM